MIIVIEDSISHTWNVSLVRIIRIHLYSFNWSYYRDTRFPVRGHHKNWRMYGSNIFASAAYTCTASLAFVFFEIPNFDKNLEFWNVRIRYECSVKWLQVKNFIKSDVRNLYVTFFHIHQIEFNLTRYQFTQILTFFMNQTVRSFSDKVTWFSKCQSIKLHFENVSKAIQSPDRKLRRKSQQIGIATVCIDETATLNFYQVSIIENID